MNAVTEVQKDKKTSTEVQVFVPMFVMLKKPFLKQKFKKGFSSV